MSIDMEHEGAERMTAAIAKALGEPVLDLGSGGGIDQESAAIPRAIRALDTLLVLDRPAAA